MPGCQSVLCCSPFRIMRGTKVWFEWGNTNSVGLIVPASTFIYGSILILVTFRPRVFRRSPVLEAMMPLPTPDMTPTRDCQRRAIRQKAHNNYKVKKNIPPETKMYFMLIDVEVVLMGPQPAIRPSSGRGRKGGRRRKRKTEEKQQRVFRCNAPQRQYPENGKR